MNINSAFPWEFKIYEQIRYDYEVNIGSIVDVIAWASGKDQTWSMNKLRYLLQRYPLLAEKIMPCEWGQSSKVIPFATLRDLVAIVWLISPEAEKVSRSTILYWAFCPNLEPQDLKVEQQQFYIRFITPIKALWFQGLRTLE
jgi:hypothetical protein